jgi:hypothetical protein
LAIAQKLLGRKALEDRLSLPFSLGYVFGAAAWHTDRFQVKRPGRDADEVVLSAYREVLGPLVDAEISALVDSVAGPGFNEGIDAAARDMDAMTKGASGAYGLVRFLLSGETAWPQFAPEGSA